MYVSATEAAALEEEESRAERATASSRQSVRVMVSALFFDSNNYNINLMEANSFKWIEVFFLLNAKFYSFL